MSNYPLRYPVIMVEQPLGVFYVASIPAKILLETCYSDRLYAKPDPSGSGYKLGGTQRALQTPRLKEIALYIDTQEAAFPNTIILAANFRKEDGLIEEKEALRWRIENGKNPDSLELVIPSGAALAAIIDGQHRLFAFSFAERGRLDVDMVCSIFLDLPRPYQAFLFATINSTQKSVDKSQTYELFGYNVEEEPPARWSPDKLAVFFARKLNSEPTPLKGRILIAAENEFVMSRAEARRHSVWMVSMATIVDGIMALVSRNPKVDSYTILANGKSDRSILTDQTSDAPLRSLYLASNDVIIYRAVLNFLTAADTCLWQRAKPNSYITKSIGIQALFDILKLLSRTALQRKNFAVSFFSGYLERASAIDFSAEFFAVPSGSGRSQLRKFLIVQLGLPEAESISEQEKARFTMLRA